MVTNPANLEEAILAAQNVAAGLITIQEDLAAIDPNTVIPWYIGGMTASAVLGIIANTQFIITDQNYNDNGGVGEAVYGQDGAPNLNYLDFRSFVGPDSYASPNYANGQGMNGILLHEIGHLSPQGNAFLRTNSATYFRENNNSLEGYVYSDYWINVEKFSNDFMRAAAAAANIDISTYNPRYGYGAVNPGRVRR